MAGVLYPYLISMTYLVYVVCWIRNHSNQEKFFERIIFSWRNVRWGGVLLALYYRKLLWLYDKRTCPACC